MKNIINTIAIVSSCLIFTSCEDLLLGEKEPNTVLNNFDVFGQDFQEKYGLFHLSKVKWETLLKEHRTLLEANPSQDNLYAVLTGLIDELNDAHVSLSHPAGAFKSYEGGISGRLDRQGYKDFDLKVVRENYLTEIGSIHETIYYGTIQESIGYIYLPEILDDVEFYESYFPEVLKNLSETKGLIIDLRNNDGGEDEGARSIASFFADQKRKYMISKYKIGPGEDDFENPRNWYVEPAKTTYLKPIVILTNRYTISAGETLTLAFKTNPRVIQVGDTTTGAFSDAVSRQLPNGWGYTISVGDYRNAENISYEQIGLAPDILVDNDIANLNAGIDLVLAYAINYFN